MASRTFEPKNIVVFGASGVGKSSVINMLLKIHGVEGDIPIIGHTATACTLDSTAYPMNRDGIVLWDTAGLSDGLSGDITFNQAIIKLYQLLDKLKDGVSLLVLVDRGPRCTEPTIRNYKIFHDIFCRAKVPAVLVLTGMEGHVSDWWAENLEVLEKSRLYFKGQASIVATPPQCDEHIPKLHKLLDCRLPEPWKPEMTDESKLTVDFYNYLAPILGWSNIDTPLTKALKECGKATPKEALRLQRYAKLDKQIQAFKRREGIDSAGKR